MINRLRLLLYPFSLIYGLATRLRNLLFDNGLLPSQSFRVPVISVGNITVGGTGKTPHAEYLLRLLSPYCKLALVSRGYMRQTKGVVVAGTDATSSTIGDEPLQIKLKFPHLTVVVAEKRVSGINECLLQKPSPQAIVLDDAYQHRYVRPHCAILLVDYNRPIWKDHLLPAGNLRESVSGIKRAQIVVVTKCPAQLAQGEADIVRKKLKLAPSQMLFFTSFSYGEAYPLSVREMGQPFLGGHFQAILAFTAIANARPFHDHLRGLADVFEAIVLPDHHRFTVDDLTNLENSFEKINAKDKWIVVTEKDAVKLKEMEQHLAGILPFVVVLPIEPTFLFSQKQLFDSQILNYVGKS